MGLRRRNQRPRQANEDEVQGWFNSADEREQKSPVKPLNNQQRHNYLRAKNPVRYYRMRSDMRWAMKLYVKLGLDPEEVRWLF
jgi:hypothetical protein